MKDIYPIYIYIYRIYIYRIYIYNDICICICSIPSTVSTARADQDSCRGIIADAAADLRDAAEGRQVRPCPVLTALATVNPKKSAPGMYIYVYIYISICFS